MKYVYPAILVPLNEEHFQGYGVEFPDLENAFTEGVDLYDALYMAEDLLSGLLIHMENDGEEIPAPTHIKALNAEGENFVTLVRADTDSYRAYLDELEEYRKNNPKAENDAEDDECISDWLAQKIFKAAGINPDE